MRFFKSGATLMIIFVAIILGGQPAHAETLDKPIVARNPVSTVVTSATVDSVSDTNPVEIVVQPGDTLTQIAARYDTTVATLVGDNDITDPNLIAIGTVLKLGQTAVSQSEVSSYDSLRAAADQFMTPSLPVSTVAPVTTARLAASRAVSTSGNTYAWGNCTWYIKERKPYLPNQLGNAGYSWVSGLVTAGYASGTTPAVGAIGVVPGHVVIVESINDDGTVNVSEMNYGGGLGVVHYRTTSASAFTYIYA